jgi:hypothetical protein
MLNTYLHVSKSDKKIIKKIDLDTILWLDGKKTGNLKARFEIVHEAFLEQKIAGVMTETGLMKAAPVILTGSKGVKSSRISELSSLFESFNELIFTRQKELSNDLKKDIEKSERKIKIIVDKFNTALLHSEKRSSTSYVYSDLMDLIKAQGLFLDIGEQLWTTYDRLEPFMDSSYYLCLELLLKRGEFDLSNMTLEQTVKPVIMDAKIKIAFRYQKFIYDILDRVFDDLENKGLSFDQRKFIEFFLAYTYFRITDFRETLLKTLSEETYIEESPPKSDIIKLVLFNWKEEFFSLLPADDPQFASNRNLLESAIRKNWTKKFRSRGIIFFYFVREWCEYVKKTLVVSDIMWESIPGYEVLVANFIEQMKKREVRKYPEVLIESSLALLNNANLLKPFVFTLLEKTKFIN